LVDAGDDVVFVRAQADPVAAGGITAGLHAADVGQPSLARRSMPLAAASTIDRRSSAGP
jgi:hypothetical protein